MNFVLFDDADFVADDRVHLQDHRAEHLLKVVGVQTGDQIRCGQIGGRLGHARVLSVKRDQAADSIELETELTQEPPAPSRIDLICALPRPKMLRRIVRTCAELGINRVILVNSYRVEKSYWQTPNLAPEQLRRFAIEGLQQAGDTIPPQIQCEPRFKPFVEDRLPGLLEHKLGLLAHPKAPDIVAARQLAIADIELMIAVGPEGGWIDYEIDKLIEAGLQAVHFGPRIQRCDTFVPFVVGLVSRLNKP